MTTGVAPERRRPQRSLLPGIIDGDGDRSHAGPGQRRAPRPSVSSAARAAARVDDHRRTTAGFPRNAASERVPPAASGSEKSGAGNGSYIQVARGADAGAGTADVVVPGRSRLEGLRLDLTPFDDPQPGVQRHVGEHLRGARGPADRQLQDPLARAQAEEQLLRVLRQEPGAGLHDLRPADAIGLDGHAGADRVAVARSCPRGARRATPASPRNRCGRCAAAAPAAPPSRRGPDRRRRRCRGPRTSGRPDRGRARPRPRSRRSRRGRRCAGTRCAAGWRSSRESAAGSSHATHRRRACRARA